MKPKTPAAWTAAPWRSPSTPTAAARAATAITTRQSTRAWLERRAERLCRFSVGWNALEGGVAVTAGIIAGSVALTSWGIDSIIEVFTAVLVLIHLRAVLAGQPPDEAQERRFLKFIAVTFFALAVYVVADAFWRAPMAHNPGRGL